jgi:[protein-PII] uridylyltransferase
MRLRDAVAARGEQSKSVSKAFSLAPDVMMDNNLSNRYTVIEISGLDRPGLLYELTAALSDLNLNIGSAHIATFGEKAVDVFYVTDLTGLKITNPSRQNAIQRRLIEIFSAGETKATPKRKTDAGAA